jgi:hypothetical protein
MAGSLDTIAVLLIHFVCSLFHDDPREYRSIG